MDEEQRDEPGADIRSAQPPVHHREHFHRSKRLVASVLAQDSDGHGGVERGCGSLARNVADRDRQAAVAIQQKVVEVSGEFASGRVHRRYIDAGNFTDGLRQKLALNIAGGIEVAEQTQLVFTRGGVEARIFERDGNVGTQDAQHALVFGAECFELGALQVQHAYQAALQQQRDYQLGADALAIGKFHVARIAANIVHANGFAFTGGETGYAFVQGNADARANGFA